MKQSKKIDMTKGPIMKLVILFALPICAGNILQQLYVYSGLITMAAGILVTIFCRPILNLFTSDQTVRDLAVHYVQVVLPFTWTFSVFNCIICYVNGIGEVKYPTIINILMLWAVRIPTAYLIVYLWGGYYLMACFPVSFTFGMVCMLLYYKVSRRWRDLLASAEKEPA